MPKFININFTLYGKRLEFPDTKADNQNHLQHKIAQKLKKDYFAITDNDIVNLKCDLTNDVSWLQKIFGIH